MLASAFVSRRRRMHCRGSDTAAQRELTRLAPRGDLQPRRRRAEVEPAGGAHAEESQGRQQRAAGATEHAPVAGPSLTAREAADGGEMLGTGSASAAVEQEQEAPPAATTESARSSAELCAVCLEDVRGAASAALPCSHAYHPRCLLPWFAVHRACPCCRAAVPPLSPEETGDTT